MYVVVIGSVKDLSVSFKCIDQFYLIHLKNYKHYYSLYMYTKTILIIISTIF